MKLKVILASLLMGSLVFFLSGCTTIEGEIIIAERSLEYQGFTDMTIHLNYVNLLESGASTDLRLKFIPGEHLQVLKDNKVITEDLITNVTGEQDVEYTLKASKYISEQKVENVVVTITSSDGKISKTLTSEFVLIKK